MRTWHIYGLRDPKTGRVRYVGKSIRMPDRLRHHRNGKNPDDNPHKFRWLRQLHADGLRPVVEILQSGDGEEWADAERKWIAKFRSAGEPLTNLTDGGDGSPGFCISDETRQKMSAAKKGRAPSAACREASIRNAIGRPLSLEHRQKLSAVLKGKKRTQETRNRISAAKRGTKASEETRRKISAALMGRRRSEKQIERMREIAKGRKFHLHFAIKPPA